MENLDSHSHATSPPFRLIGPIPVPPHVLTNPRAPLKGVINTAIRGRAREFERLRQKQPYFQGPAPVNSSLKKMPNGHANSVKKLEKDGRLSKAALTSMRANCKGFMVEGVISS